MTTYLRLPFRRFRAAEGGAAAVEFALVVPVLMVLLFGIMGFGWFLGIAHSLQEAASQSARASVAGMDIGERSAVAIATIKRRTSDNPLIDPNSLTVDVGPDAVNPDLFTVTLRYDMSENLLKIIPTFVPLPTTITRTASIRRGGL
ncbi:TadE/TadG family type IV pilus assembly protein [Methylobacterium sp. CM6241]